MISVTLISSFRCKHSVYSFFARPLGGLPPPVYASGPSSDPSARHVLVRPAVASLHHHVHARQHASRGLQSDGWNRFVAGRATCSVATRWATRWRVEKSSTGEGTRWFGGQKSPSGAKRRRRLILKIIIANVVSCDHCICLLYTSPSPRD